MSVKNPILLISVINSKGKVMYLKYNSKKERKNIPNKKSECTERKKKKKEKNS